jgi:hypothetical protein
VAGDPEAMALRAERRAKVYAAAAGLSLALAVALNYALAFLLWRLAL